MVFRKQRCRLAILLLSLLMLAGAPDNARAGLKGVAVRVDLEMPAGCGQGLSTAALQADVEAVMRRAGIASVPREPVPRSGAPLIYVNAKIAPINGQFAYNIDIIYLAGPGDRGIKGGNCRLEAAGLVTAAAQVRGKVKGLVRAFIRKYLARQDQTGSSRCAGVSLRLTVLRA